jgi:spermidine/putrescine transport system permease protein
VSDTVGDAVDRRALTEVTEAYRPPPRQGERRLARRKRVAAYSMLAPGGLYLLLSFIVPLALIVVTSLSTGGGLFDSGDMHFSWAFENYSDMLSQYSSVFLRSIVYSAVGTGITILLAYPMAYWIAFYAGRWKSTLFFLILVPFFVSFVIRTIMWGFILGDHGMLFGTLKSWGVLPEDFRVLATPVAVIAGLAYNFLPFTALPLYVALERIDRRMVEAAKDLYATRWQAFRKVVLPLSYPGVFAAVILTFVPMTGDYVNATVLGQQPTTTMIGQVIQDYFLSRNNYPDAAALSVLLMVGMLLIALVYARVLGTEDSTLAGAVS